MRKVEFYRHNIGDDEIERVNEVLRSLFITTGDAVSEFERELAGYLGLPHAVAVTSCTSAMQLALIAGGIRPGDEVITTPLSFVGTANSIIMAGGTPVFADVERSTGNIDPAAIEAAIGPRTRALLPVHLYGQCCRMDRIREIADRHGLLVVEDAAHALEADWRGKRSGHWGDFACFSFYATKNITSGEGGAISAKTDEHVDLLRKLRLHGMSRHAIDRYTKHFRQYDVDTFGWKCNMDNIHAALLIGQLRKVGEWRARRQEIWERYAAALAGIDGIELHEALPDGVHSYHLFTFLVDADRRLRIMDRLQDRGIGLSLNFHPIHLFTWYRETFGYAEGMFPVAEEIGRRTISLPLYPKLADEEIDYVVDNVREAMRER
ncbi:MAG: DegT/DnrJ/EryC1/StrS family aminotransferase [Candidatus Krumholzibacteriota bacterium]|nr:DegT/DnrJ/EryC1/StrS family aminotransferase [Candidatus Krumholzibacteriota bacterium]